MIDNRPAWEAVAEKYHREYAELRAIADSGSALLDREREVLAPILATGPLVVHLQSGDGTEDAALTRAGARRVVGVDFSAGATAATQRRAAELGVPVTYVHAQLPGAPFRDGCADLVYTGKGALNWMRDLDAWAADVARLLRPGGHVYAYEGHPATALWSWDLDKARIRADRSYFGESFVNDSFPAHGAVESQATLGRIVTAVIGAGLELRMLAEYPEPFWKMGDVDVPAFDGRLPNTFALLASKPHR